MSRSGRECYSCEGSHRKRLREHVLIIRDIVRGARQCYDLHGHEKGTAVLISRRGRQGTSERAESTHHHVQVSRADLLVES